jgi:ABC-2 type transport system permease protein
VLPAALRPIGYVMPLTYWLELLRRAMVGQVAEAFPTLSHLGNQDLLAILVGLTLLFGVVGAVTFRWCEHRARERGRIDATTNY